MDDKLRFASGRWRSVLATALVLSCLLGSCSRDRSSADARWYRGNTHAHTELCGHADSTPTEVVRWYRDHGYDFLVLSEHNLLIAPAEVKAPPGGLGKLLLIPGEELTGAKDVIGVNLPKVLRIRTKGLPTTEGVRMQVDAVLAAGGLPIVAHPASSKLAAQDLLPVGAFSLLEIHNAHHRDLRPAEAKRWSEELWDELLSTGRVIYGVATDDSHQLKASELAHPARPGRAWVMVRAEALSPGAITDALRRGDFYGSTGVILTTVSTEGGSYRVAVDVERTREQASASQWVGRAGDAGPPWEIRFIGPGGRVVHRAMATTASYPITKEHSYLRCKVSYRLRGEGGTKIFHAWTQPVFTDGRR